MNLNNVSNQNFRGFKNPIVNHIGDKNFNFSMLSMQLTNDGIRDLDKLRELRQSPLMSKSLNKNSDILNLILINKFNDTKLVFDNNAIPLCDDLIELKNQSGSRFAKDYAIVEKSVLRQCTFISDLTRRIMSLSAVTLDSELSKVVVYTQQVLEKIFKNKNDAFKFIFESAEKNMEPQFVARKINESIAANMAKFFRV